MRFPHESLHSISPAHRPARHPNHCVANAFSCVRSHESLCLCGMRDHQRGHAHRRVALVRNMLGKKKPVNPCRASLFFVSRRFIRAVPLYGYDLFLSIQLFDAVYIRRVFRLQHDNPQLLPAWFHRICRFFFDNRLFSIFQRLVFEDSRQ